MKKIIILIVVLAGVGVFGWIRITNQLLSAEFREIITAGIEATELAHANAESYAKGTFSNDSAEADIQKIEQSINILESRLKVRYPRLQEIMVNHMKVAQNVIRFRQKGNDRLEGRGFSSPFSFYRGPDPEDKILLYRKSDAEDKKLEATIMSVCAYVEMGIAPPLPADMRGDEDAFKTACAEMRTKSIKTVVKQSRYEELDEIIEAGLLASKLSNINAADFARGRFASARADDDIKKIDRSINKLEAKEYFYHPKLRDIIVRQMKINQNMISYRLKGQELLERKKSENIDLKSDFEWATFSSEADAEDQKRKDTFKDVCGYFEQNIDTMSIPVHEQRQASAIRSVCTSL